MSSLTFRDVLVSKLLRAEDKCARIVLNLPDSNRVDSFPFANSDTYAFSCAFEMSKGGLIKRTGQGESLYINGNELQEVLPLLFDYVDGRNQPLDRLVIGDADFSPTQSVLSEISTMARKVFCVNLPATDSPSIARALPLGLESQRYRSAGQLRDFKRIPEFDAFTRSIGLLVAWNDATYPTERSLARRVLKEAKTALEVVDRVPARLIHRLMRRSLFVVCPRGNGLDTHRFWESLYLGAIPVVLSKHNIPAFYGWPSLVLKEWEELLEFDEARLQDLYFERAPDLMSFRGKMIEFIVSEMRR